MIEALIDRPTTGEDKRPKTDRESGFLSDAELAHLTGRRHKSKQIEWLRGEGIPFRVNATGHPVVTWEAVNGRRAAPVQTGWRSKALES